MFQLLIVDDEIEILEWLRELFEKEKEEEICIYTAASGKKAIEILNSVKCDVVLTDIKMPGMDGLALYRHVKENWPLAKIVFLTGYGTHEILYQVAKDKAVRYLVKTEPPRRIVETVLDAYHELLEYQKHMLAESKKDALLLKAKYWLQKELVERLIGGEEGTFVAEQLAALEIPFDTSFPVMVFVGRANEEKGVLTYEHKENILYLLRENVPGIMFATVYFLEGNYVLGIIQPRLTGTQCDWKRIFHVCAGMLENVQSVCQKEMEKKLPFAIYEDVIAIGRLGSIYYLLKERLVTIANEENPGILLVGPETNETGKTDHKIGLIRIPMLDHYLEQGNYQECKNIVKEIAQPLLKGVSMYDVRALELYYNVSMVFLKHINANDWEEKVPFYVALYPLTRVDDFKDWSEAVEYLIQLTDVFSRLKCENEDYYKNLAIGRVEAYIREHLKDDLGLQVLAEVGGFNASYLSRIFKQKYHCNLSEYITRERIGCARKLLAETDEKIYRIGEEIGYQTVSSFNRVFKKSEGISPAEYRMRYQTKK